MQISIKITGSKETQAKLKRLGGSLLQNKIAMRLIGEELAQYYSNDVFASQGAVLGAKWPSLSERYAARKARRYSGRGPLVATGAMQKSFVYKYSETQTFVTNNAPQFPYHQSSAPRKKIPRRQMIGINTVIRNRVQSIIQEEVARKIRTA